MCSFSPSKLIVGGSCRCFSASSTLIAPATPAAARQCPMFDFTDPSPQYSFFSVYFRKAFFSPSTSTGSPSFVPVPCASISCMLPGSIPYRSYTSCSSRVCDSGFGAVIPFVFPS